MEPRKRVVIVGAGFGGLAAARALKHAPVDVTIVDRRNFHLFQPLLYQVATAALSPADISAPIRSILRDQDNARVVLGKVVGIDRERRRVLIEDGSAYVYDWLVLATGARHSYFGRDEWASLAPGIKTIDDATKLRAKILLAFERAEIAPSEAERKALLTFAIVGGGPTGVELAGAIAELARHAASRDFRAISASDMRVILIESGPRILQQFREDLSRAAHEALERMGVEIWTGQPVTDISADRILVGDRALDMRNVIWAAGVRASAAGRWLGAVVDRAGRVMVREDFSLSDDPSIFVIGDTAHYARRDGALLPGVAPAAKQAGDHVGALIAARAADQPEPTAFLYVDRGMLATVGRNFAVVHIGRLVLTGFPGWALWSLAHVWFLAGFRSRVSVAFNWAWSYLTWERGARLITGAEVARAAMPEAIKSNREAA